MVLDVKTSAVSLFVANYVDASKNPKTFIVRTRVVTQYIKRNENQM